MNGQSLKEGRGQEPSSGETRGRKSLTPPAEVTEAVEKLPPAARNRVRTRLKERLCSNSRGIKVLRANCKVYGGLKPHLGFPLNNTGLDWSHGDSAQAGHHTDDVPDELQTVFAKCEINKGTRKQKEIDVGLSHSAALIFPLVHISVCCSLPTAGCLVVPGNCQLFGGK